jgi:hypothetical protein
MPSSISTSIIGRQPDEAELGRGAPRILDGYFGRAISRVFDDGASAENSRIAHAGQKVCNSPTPSE